jgi:rhodanese-related sulfurtransferase
MGEPERKPLLLDVREPWEIDICGIAGSLPIAMGEIPVRLSELPTDREIVVICHHGARSYQVASYLMGMGIGQVANLDGGIDAWARQVDATMSTY